MPLSDIVNVVITRQTQTVSEAGFGVPMILGANNAFTGRIKFYSDMAGVALDFSPNDPEYIAAQDIFSQSISPALIAIGRRQVNAVSVQVISASGGNTYTVAVNGVNYTITATSPGTNSSVALASDLVPANRIALSLNGTNLGTTTSVIDFDSDFVAANSIVATINGAPIAPVVFNTDQATTIAALATALAGTAAIATAVVTGPNQITAVFAAPGNGTINSIVTTGGVSQPVADIAQGGFVFNTSSAQTMLDIKTAIEALPNVDQVVLSGINDRTLTVFGTNGNSMVINSFVVTGGASQTGSTISTFNQNPTVQAVAQQLVTALAGVGAGFTISAPSVNGVFSVTTNSPGTGFTLTTSDNIVTPNFANVNITQIEPNQLYRISLNGVNFDYTSLPNVQSGQEIALALVNLINANPNINVNAVDLGTGSFTLEAVDGSNGFSISVSPEIMSTEFGIDTLPLVPSDSVTADLDAIENANNDWYAIVSTSRDVPTVKSIATWTEVRKKIFGTASSDPVIIDVAAGADNTSIAAWANQQGLARTFVMYHQDAAFDYPEAAWFGRVLPLEPGSENWAYKTLNSISISNLTTNQSINALSKKANTYEFIGGVAITRYGTMGQGEYIDIIRGVDWLTARIQEFVYSVLVNNPKVPYTDAGIASVQSQVLRALQLGISNNFIAESPQPIVTVPLAANVPPTDKANRILRNVKFTATLAGAINIVNITGNVQI